MKWLYMLILVFSFITPVEASEHFKDREFACKCCGKVLVDQKLIDKLEELRGYMDLPIIITSGYRCSKHNKEVGGVKNSQHIRGKAVDIKVKGMSVRELEEVCKWAEFSFIKRYKSWVHVDVR